MKVTSPCLRARLMRTGANACMHACHGREHVSPLEVPGLEVPNVLGSVCTRRQVCAWARSARGWVGVTHQQMGLCVCVGSFDVLCLLGGKPRGELGRKLQSLTAQQIYSQQTNRPPSSRCPPTALISHRCSIPIRALVLTAKRLHACSLDARWVRLTCGGWLVCEEWLH
jgi:hypothetical protein